MAPSNLHPPRGRKSGNANDDCKMLTERVRRRHHIQRRGSAAAPAAAAKSSPGTEARHCGAAAWAAAFRTSSTTMVVGLAVVASSSMASRTDNGASTHGLRTLGILVGLVDRLLALSERAFCSNQNHFVCCVRSFVLPNKIEATTTMEGRDYHQLGPASKVRRSALSLASFVLQHRSPSLSQLHLGATVTSQAELVTASSGNVEVAKRTDLKFCRTASLPAMRGLKVDVLDVRRVDRVIPSIIRQFGKLLSMDTSIIPPNLCPFFPAPRPAALFGTHWMRFPLPGLVVQRAPQSCMAPIGT